MPRVAATLAAPVGANSQATEYFFQYGPTSEYGSQTSPASAGSGASAAIVSSNVNALAPSTVYHFRAVATNASGTTYGTDQTFTTATAPTASTLPATGTTLTSGTLHGAIDPNGQATTYHFDWGTSTAYGSQAPLVDASVGSDSSEHAVEQSLSGLSPGHQLPLQGRREQLRRLRGRHHLRAGPHVHDRAGAARGHRPAQAVGQSTATLTGTANPQGALTTYHFDWGTSTAYGNQAPRRRRRRRGQL